MNYLLNNYQIVAAMGEKIDEVLCSGIFSFCLLKYSKNFWKSSTSSICYLRLRFSHYVFIYRWDDCQDAHKGYIKGNYHNIVPNLHNDLHKLIIIQLQRDKSYLKDHWCQFDGSMVVFLWLSVILQMFEMLGFVLEFSYVSILRAPRPLIMIRFLRVFLKFSMPKSRINQIFK